MPFIFLPIVLVTAAPKWLMVCAAVSVGLVYANRIALKIRFRQSGLGAALHPVGIVMLLVLQWTALVNRIRGRPMVWRKRAYSHASGTE
jgi:ABC-type dipeptide/oligopeptide/nickel transport system permease subunit